MCFQCDNPELTYDDYLDEVIRPMIHQNGWAVQGVTGRRPFAYTVGLTDCGLPELIVTGMRDVAAAGLLNDVARRVLRDELEPGTDVHVCEHLRLVALPVSFPEQHLLTATALYGDDVRALQLVWPDDRGRYPWDVGHRSQRGGQALLGPPPC